MPSDDDKQAGAFVMSDDDRAQQPRVAHGYPLPGASDATPRDAAAPSYALLDDVTPPPIVVDAVGRPLVALRPEDAASDAARERKRIQEVVEDLWPSRHALQISVELLQRIVRVETKVDDMEANGPAAVSAARVAGLRAEVVGEDGSGGIVGHLAETCARDLADHRAQVDAVKADATAAARFVRRVLYGAGSLVGGGLVGGILLIYAAGQKSEAGKSEVRESRVELVHKLETSHADLVHEIDTLDASLTALRAEVKLLLEAQVNQGRRGHAP